MPPPTTSPLVSNTLLNKLYIKRFPHYLYRKCYTFPARIDDYLNFITHRKPEFSTQISKKFLMWEGDTPPHTLPLGVHYIILNNFKTVSPHLLYCNHYTFSARTDVNSNFIMHPKPGLVPQKSPHRGTQSFSLCAFIYPITSKE